MQTPLAAADAAVLCAAGSVEDHPGAAMLLTPPGTTVRLGSRAVVYNAPGSPLQPLRDSSALLGDAAALRAELAAAGFLFVRGLHDRAQVLAARLQVSPQSPHETPRTRRPVGGPGDASGAGMRAVLTDGLTD